LSNYNLIFSIFQIAKPKQDDNMKRDIQNNAQSGALYGLGFIGAAIYFISHSTGFWMGVIGFLKAIVWPALLVYEAFRHLAM
jgi:hypothetical protein